MTESQSLKHKCSWSITIERFHMTAASLVYQNKGTAAMLVYKSNPLGIEVYSYANHFFSFIKPILWFHSRDKAAMLVAKTIQFFLAEFA